MEYNPRRGRRCGLCGELLEAGEEYECLVRTGPSHGGEQDRVWFCGRHGSQVRAAVRALTGASVV